MRCAVFCRHFWLISIGCPWAFDSLFISRESAAAETKRETLTAATAASANCLHSWNKGEFHSTDSNADSNYFFLIFCASLLLLRALHDPRCTIVLSSSLSSLLFTIILKIEKETTTFSIIFTKGK